MLRLNTIHQGDCLQLLGQLESGSVDLVFADPPFNIGYEYDVYQDAQSSDDYLAWCRRWIDGVYRSLKPDGSFWLAIGDEYVAELKIAAQAAGFHLRSWVIWYYTFGVNCANGFSRSHTHLLYFVKDKRRFTFNRPNPNVRVKSARQLVYADLRANPTGRLPDNTWITRPQDLPSAFSPNHDTWYYARVAGTFKEREGFHGCQMPEQLLGRIILTSSHPYDLVLDPFGGSGTTLCVAKKLHRRFIGFELSANYAKHIRQRLSQTQAGAALDGPADPVESAPQTAEGKQRSKARFDADTCRAVIDAFQTAADGFPVDYVLCDRELDERFVQACLKRGLGGNAIVWNRLLLQLRKSGKLPRSTRRIPPIPAAKMNRYSYASEVAWRLIADDFSSGVLPFSLDDILCCPDTAAYFDQLARQYGPQDTKVTSLQYRRAALSIRKMAKSVRALAARQAQQWPTNQFTRISPAEVATKSHNKGGVYLIAAGPLGVFAGETSDLRHHLTTLFENEHWNRLQADEVLVQPQEFGYLSQCALKTVLVQQRQPLLNAKAWCNGSL